jgi:hypothetical protein
MNVDSATMSLAGLFVVQTGGICFFLGGLANKVTHSATRIDRLESGDDMEGSRREDIVERLASVEGEVRHLKEAIEPLQKELRGISRQISSLVTGSGRRGIVGPLMDTQGD